MSPRREPASASSWEDRTAFREVFLVNAPAAGAVTLRRFGRYMYETLAASGIPTAAETGGPASVRVQVRAVAEDLRFCARALASLGADSEGAEATAEGSALAKKAESWAREVLDLVRAMESAAAGAGGSE